MGTSKTHSIITIGSGDKKQVVSGRGPTINVQGKPTQQGSATGQQCVDLVFVIDTTGSMSNKIDGLIANCARFVQEFGALDLDHRVATVSFGDLTVPGDGIETSPFSSDVQTITQSLRCIVRYSGGGNEGESSLEAIEKALALPFRSNAVKVIILITDEPALQHRLRAGDLITALSLREVLTFVISPPYSYFKEMASRNGGKWYQVAGNTDLDDLLEMFRQTAHQVSQVVSDVYRVGEGSVSSYLRLKPPQT